MFCMLELLPISIMPNIAPAIFPSHPKRPKVRKAAATKPAMLSPDTLPLARLPKKLPNISTPLPPKMPRKKLVIPLHLLLTSLMAPLTASMASPALFFNSFTSLAASEMVSTAFSPTTASPTISTTLLSVVSFSHAT